VTGVWRKGVATCDVYAGAWLVGRRQGRLARPIDVRRMATRHRVWTLVRGRGTSGRSGAPAVVLGRPSARAGVARRTRRHAWA
jgi:hypothetical protein